MSRIGYDNRAITIDGKRFLVLSGSVHYPRSTPAMWPDIIKRSKDAGLNTIETYVFWNLHERKRGVYDFSDRLDLRHFAEIVAQNDMRMILRIGPYICAETNYGGFPPWLRDIPGMMMRTWNRPFMHEMERWVRLLCEYMRPMFAPAGGPIILSQIENEYDNISPQYGEAGQKYLKWCVKLAKSLDTGVPLIMCVGSVKGALETINSFYGHEPLKKHLVKFPAQPALWTEFWGGWYNTFGYPIHKRRAEDVAYALARFFAAGGSGMNYYMWHGGTNLGRTSMYLQTTSYDFDAPLDEFGLPTTKSNHVARIHKILAEHADLLLADKRRAPRETGARQTIWTYKSSRRTLTFLCNDDDKQSIMRFNKKDYKLAAKSVLLVSNGRKLMDTAMIARTDLVSRTMVPQKRALSEFKSWNEPLPSLWPEHLKFQVTAKQPVEQLQFTKDCTDYCWYSISLNLRRKEADRGTLTFPCIADVAHVFVDGRLVASTTKPLPEDRALCPEKANNQAGARNTFQQSFELTIPAGRHELSILCCAIGMIKGDWMLGRQNMVHERKGIWADPLWNGTPIHGAWNLQPGLLGEIYGVYGAAQETIGWRRASGKVRQLTWLRTEFTRPAGSAPVTLDLAGMTKGMLWLNGRCAGRYWLIAGTGEDNISSWAQISITVPPSDQPTQRYYHLPREWMKERNTIVLFEEAGGRPSDIRLCKYV